MDYTPVTQLVEVCHWLSRAQWECREIQFLRTTGTGIGDGNIFQLLTKFIVIITQCSWCVPGCPANCASCDTARTCTECNEGYIVNTDRSGCDGKFIVK